MTSRQFLVSAPTPAYCGSFLFEARSTAIRESISGPLLSATRRLASGRFVLGFGHRRDVFGGIAQRQELAPAWHRDGVNEPFEPNQ